MPINQSDQILKTLKGLLKQHHLNYSQVAEHLNLSESSVKRVFSSGQISLNRLVDICALMDLDIGDLLQALHNQSSAVSRLTEKQEQVITSDIKLLLITTCVYNNWTFEQITDTYKIEDAELVKLLLKLERIHFLELKPNNKIKLKASQNFQWIKNGPIQRFFETQIQKDFLASSFTGPGELRLVLTGMLSKKNNKIIQEKIQKLGVEFNQLSQQDKLIPMHDRHGTNLLIAIRPWELAQFDALRREKNRKIFR